MTFKRLCDDELRVIELALPTAASPQLLGEARGWCLSLIERLESLKGFTLIDGVPDKMLEDMPEKMRCAQARLVEIDAALSALGYNPDKCGWDRPPLH
jgi:hypothetical protein